MKANTIYTNWEKDMKGDFTRDTFDRHKHFVRVLMQQGRVQLDADQHEENAIILHYLQSLAKDLIGTNGGPFGNCGFEIIPLGTKEASGWDFAIGCGHYYIDGLLCEADSPTTTIVKIEQTAEKSETGGSVKYVWVRSKEKLKKISENKTEHLRVTTYTEQLDYPLPESEKLALKTKFPRLVFLDVWERHITYIEDGSIREVALGGPDTATRSKIVWQVKTCSLKGNLRESIRLGNEEIQALLLEKFQPRNGGRLKARAKQPTIGDMAEPCVTPQEACYSGAENHLYRVEIHQGSRRKGPTFKWSRENGSVAFPIRRLAGGMVTLETLGIDSRLGLNEGDLVEIEDDDYVLQNRAEKLSGVVEIDRTKLQVQLDEKPASTVGTDPKKHPILRRWDHKRGDPKTGGLTLNDGAATIRENEWLNLESGVQILFENGGHTYRAGDYWLIPARTVTRNVEWPGTATDPEALPPHGVMHHYAPLAIISMFGKALTVKDCRLKFK
jgi:hypothetical protein